MLGNFLPGVHAMEKLDVDLLKLSGSVDGTNLEFLLDSGASCNFISSATVAKIGAISFPSSG